MSSAKGSRLFAGDRRNIVKVLTISLSALAVLSIVLFGYQEYSKPHLPNLMSKDDAIHIVLTAGNWNEQTLGDKKIETTLVHVRANGFSFVVDPVTLQESITLYHNQCPSYENQYLWIVSIVAPNNSDWVYTINASSGKLATPP